MLLYAVVVFVVFVVFAIVGGLAVRFIIKNQPEPGEGDLPQRGIPWDASDSQE